MLLLLNRGYFLLLNLRPWQCKLTLTRLVFAHRKNQRKGAQWQQTRLWECVCLKEYLPFMFVCVSTYFSVWACVCSCIWICMYEYICVHLEMFHVVYAYVWMKHAKHVFKISTMWGRLQYLKCSTIFTGLGCASLARAEVRLLTHFLFISSLCIYCAALAGPQAKPILFDSP